MTMKESESVFYNQKQFFPQVFLMAADGYIPTKFVNMLENSFYFEGKSDFMFYSFSIGKLDVTTIWYNILYIVFIINNIT